MTREKGEPWFVYERRVGEIRAEPANLKGWLALIGGILGTVGAGLYTFFALHDWSLFAAILALVAITLVGILGMLWLAVAKGRPVSEPR